MATRVKIVKKVDLEEHWSGKRAKSITMQSVIERLKPHIGEIIIYGLVILLLAAGTYWRNRTWNSPIELWTDCVKKSPNKQRPHYNLGNEFFRQGKYQEAVFHLTQALRIDPNYSPAHNNLGTVLARQGK
jgi:tetratricopeptide (TPR) repeat protein